MSGDRTCPEHCTSKLSLHFNKNNVEINPKTGEFSMKNPSDALKVNKTVNYEYINKSQMFTSSKTDDMSFIKIE